MSLRMMHPISGRPKVLIILMYLPLMFSRRPHQQFCLEGKKVEDIAVVCNKNFVVDDDINPVPKSIPASGTVTLSGKNQNSTNLPLSTFCSICGRKNWHQPLCGGGAED
jgi:hypothetical protein